MTIVSTAKKFGENPGVDAGDTNVTHTVKAERIMETETPTTEQPENNATAAGDGQPGQPAPATFTQEQLDAIIKDRLDRAEAKTKADLLGELGIEDLKTAKQTLSEAEAARAAQMTELEKAQAEIAKAKELADKATTEAEAIKAQAAEALLKAAIISQAGQFNDPLDAWQFIDRSKVEVSEDGTYKGIDEALKSLIEAKPYLVKADGGNPGTPAKARTQTIAEKLLNKQPGGAKKPEPARPKVNF